MGLPETWITTDKLHGAIDICFTFKTSPHQLVFFLGATLFSLWTTKLHLPFYSAWGRVDNY